MEDLQTFEQAKAACEAQRNGAISQLENAYWRELIGRILEKKAQIADWQPKPETLPSEALIKEQRLSILHSELGALEAQFKAPYSTSTAQATDAATTAPVEPASDAPAHKNKSEKTLIFEAKVIELMGKFWNERTPGTEPTKGDLERLVYPEILRTNVRGARKTTAGMVHDAAKRWKYPLVLPAMVPESKFNEKRHPFKGER